MAKLKYPLNYNRVVKDAPFFATLTHTFSKESKQVHQLRLISFVTAPPNMSGPLSSSRAILYPWYILRYRHINSDAGQAGGFASGKCDLNERSADFLISRKMESFSRANALHAHPLSRAVIKQIEPLPSRRNKPHRPLSPVHSRNRAI